MKIPLSNGVFSSGFFAGAAAESVVASWAKAITRPEKKNNILRVNFLIVIVIMLFKLIQLIV